MDVAFVQHAKHDVDGDQRCKDQQPLIGQGVLKRTGGPLELSLYAGGNMQLVLEAVYDIDGLTEGGSRRQVEGKRHNGKLTLVADGDRNGSEFQMAERAQGRLSGSWKHHGGGGRGRYRGGARTGCRGGGG